LFANGALLACSQKDWTTTEKQIRWVTTSIDASCARGEEISSTSAHCVLTRTTHFSKGGEEESRAGPGRPLSEAVVVVVLPRLGVVAACSCPIRPSRSPAGAHPSGGQTAPFLPPIRRHPSPLPHGLAPGCGGRGRAGTRGRRGAAAPPATAAEDTDTHNA